MLLFPSKWIHQNPQKTRRFFSPFPFHQSIRVATMPSAILQKSRLPRWIHGPNTGPLGPNGHTLGSPNDPCTIGSHPRKVGFQSLQESSEKAGIWVLNQKIGVGPTPQNGWLKLMENPLKIDNLGVPLFLETPICISIILSQNRRKTMNWCKWCNMM